MESNKRRKITREEEEEEVWMREHSCETGASSNVRHNYMMDQVPHSLEISGIEKLLDDVLRNVTSFLSTIAEKSLRKHLWLHFGGTLKMKTIANDTSRISQLPDDVLIHIISFLPQSAEKSRTSVISRRWRHLWHNVTCLDFDVATVPRLSWEMFEKNQDWFVESVNNVIGVRVGLPQLPLVKQLRIRYKLSKTHSKHIDRWIDFAISNCVEALHLELFGVFRQSEKYKLSEESWYRNPLGLSHLKCLKSLSLSCVDANKQFIEFILSSCPLLEDLSLHCLGSYKDLDVSSVSPLGLRRLEIDSDEDFALQKLSAPNLTSFYYRSNKFEPQQIDVPLLTDLTIGSSCDAQPMIKYLKPFWNYFRQLERLELLMEEPAKFEMQEIPELVNLKYLMINFNSDTDHIFDKIIHLIHACPSLQTFAFQIWSGEMIPHPRLALRRRVRKQKWRELEEMGSFKSLNVLELYAGDEKTIDQDVVKFIITKAPHLHKLTYDLNLKAKFFGACNSLSYGTEVVRYVEEKAKKLCRRHSTNDINITIIG